MIKQNDTFSSYVTNKKLKHFKTYSTNGYLCFFFLWERGRSLCLIPSRVMTEISDTFIIKIVVIHKSYSLKEFTIS